MNTLTRNDDMDRFYERFEADLADASYRLGKERLKPNPSEPTMTSLRRERTVPCNQTVVAVFDSLLQVDETLIAMSRDDFDMKKISIVGRDYHTEQHVVAYYNVGNRMLYWGHYGASWIGFWKTLSGSGFFWVPGIGTLLVAGPLVVWTVGALEGAAVSGLSAIGAALFRLGVERENVNKYETELRSGKFLMIANGPGDEIGQAQAVLNQSTARFTLHIEPPTAPLNQP